MTDLIKMIEEEIKKNKNIIKKIQNSPYLHIELEYRLLGENKSFIKILSELKKRNCEGCRFNEVCFTSNRKIEIGKEGIAFMNNIKIDYCSNWEAK